MFNLNSPKRKRIISGAQLFRFLRLLRLYITFCIRLLNMAFSRSLLRRTAVIFRHSLLFITAADRLTTLVGGRGLAPRIKLMCAKL